MAARSVLGGRVRAPVADAEHGRRGVPDRPAVRLELVRLPPRREQRAAVARSRCGAVAPRQGDRRLARWSTSEVAERLSSPRRAGAGASTRRGVRAPSVSPARSHRSASRMATMQVVGVVAAAGCSRRCGLLEVRGGAGQVAVHRPQLARVRRAPRREAPAVADRAPLLRRRPRRRARIRSTSPSFSAKAIAHDAGGRPDPRVRVRRGRSERRAHASRSLGEEQQQRPQHRGDGVEPSAPMQRVGDAREHPSQPLRAARRRRRRRPRQAAEHRAHRAATGPRAVPGTGDVEHEPEPAARPPAVLAEHPVPTQVAREVEGAGRRRRCRRGKRSAASDVVALAVEQAQRLELPGAAQQGVGRLATGEVAGVRARAPRSPPSLGQPLRAVLAQRLQHPEPGAVAPGRR